jgi:hypothetical protein
MTTDTKYFTPAEARNTLPLVKKIVKDILSTSREMKLVAEEVKEEIENNTRIKKLADEIEGFMIELEEIGCYFKDWNFSIGLVDFPAIIDNKEVLLCWKSDEEDILYYHTFDGGFAGRLPIPAKYFNED